MSSNLKASSLKVQEFLAQHGQEFKVLQLTASTRTSVEAAEAIGCDVAQIAKSLIFRDKKSDEPVLIIASGSNMVDTRKVEKALGTKLSKPDADYVRERIGYVIGGVPPVAHNTQVRTVLDPDLQVHDIIWAAAGTPNSMFALKPDDLPTLTQGEWVELAK
jgi:prolyl-tRNA editing enzyme YbaK/EbsC (Cys-tRNA(Pro) deacylase)